MNRDTLIQAILFHTLKRPEQVQASLASVGTEYEFPSYTEAAALAEHILLEVPTDVGSLEDAWDEGYEAAVDDARYTGGPYSTPNTINPYRGH